MESIATTSRTSEPSYVPRPIADMLLTIVDTGLAAVLLLAPWFMGGRHPLGQLVLVLISVIVATAWVTRQALSRGQTVWKISGCELLLLAAIALVVLQLTPIPTQLVQALSPHVKEILPLWMPATQPPDAMGTWHQLSLTPENTRAGLVMLLCYGLLFIVTLQRIETIDDIERLLRWFAVSAIALACVGLLQYLTSNGKFLWVYQHPFRNTHDAVMGPFINKNHFAHLLALGLGPLVWSVQRALARLQAARDPSFTNGLTSGDLEWLVMVQTIGLGVVMFAGLMTFSRGGALAMFGALAVSGALLYRIGAISGRFVATFGLIALFTGGALAIHGYQRVSERLDDFSAGSIEELDVHGYRRGLWAADLAATHDFASVGTGVGSHREVYRMYLPEAWEMEMTHAENGYLQVALEAGLPGLTLLLAGIALATYWCLEALRSPKNRRVYLAAVAVASGLMASVLHSWCDFVWYISSCMAATVLLLACACRLMEFSREGRERWVWINWRISRPSLAISAAVLVVLGGWMTTNRFCAAKAAPHLDQYLAFVCSPENADGSAVPDDSLLDHLRQALKWTPDDSRAHVALAGLALKRFEYLQSDPATAVNPMPVNEICGAAMGSRFPSRQALDQWLSKAVGEHRRYMDEALWHTRQALTLCPLHGDAYLYLAQLCFLENALPETRDAYMEQAVLVRPYNAHVLITVGREAALAYDIERAQEYWQRAFALGTRERAQLIDVAARAGMSVSEFVEKFQPGWPEIGQVYQAYFGIATPAEVGALEERYLAMAEQEIPKLSRQSATKVYLDMYRVFSKTGQNQRALRCLQNAVDLEPNDFSTHQALANALRAAGDYQEAEKHLQWCIQRAPDNQKLRKQLAEVVKLRIAASTQPAESAGSGRRWE